jgi:hypothetical protein
MTKGVRVPTLEGHANILVDVERIVRDPELGEINGPYAVEAIEAWISLLADSPLHYSRGPKPKRVYTRFLCKIYREGLGSVIREYAGMADSLLKSEMVHHPGSGDRPFLAEFQGTPMFPEYLEFYKTSSKTLLRWLLSFSIFLKKGKFERSDLDTVAFRKWLEVEERLASIPLTDMYVADLATIIRELLPDPDREYFYPKHGPGQVSEGTGRSLDKKHALRTLDKKGTRLFTSVIHPLENRCDYAILNFEGEEVETHARLRFVPKDISKTRSICMEPASRMYLQQGILRMMLHAFDSGSVHRFVKIDDQSRNQAFCAQGSLFLNTDTIDLSSASDSIGWDLVKQAFPVSWVRLFAATRSSVVDHDEGSIHVKKFAPMGSAVCFPTQCVIFLSVVILAHMRYMYRKDGGFTRSEVRKTLRLTSREPYDRLLHEPSVYGDDIICDSRITGDVIQILQDLRFEVNVDKSFISSQYVRESCGVYYHNGDDITPIRFSLPHHRGRVGPSGVASYVAGANNAYTFGYGNLRRWFIRKALYTPVFGRTRWKGKPIRDTSGRLRLPFVTDPDEFGILCDPGRSKRNDHLVETRHPDWQRGGWTSLNIGLRSKRIYHADEHDRYSLALYWKAKLRVKSLTRQGHTRSLPEETRFTWGWTPK